MQQSIKPLEAAIKSYETQLQLPEKDRLSIRKIAAAFDVVDTTLLRHIKGRTKAPNQAYIHRQALTAAEETCIIDFIRRMSLSGQPPTPQTVYELAKILRDNRFRSELLDNSPIPSPLAHTWMGKFKHRHRDVIGSVWTRQLDTNRLKAESIEKLSPWFAEFGDAISKHPYKPENVYNMDETATLLVCRRIRECWI